MGREGLCVRSVCVSGRLYTNPKCCREVEYCPQLVPWQTVVASRYCVAPSLKKEALKLLGVVAVGRTRLSCHSQSSPRAAWQSRVSCAPSTGEMPTETCAPPPSGA